MYGDVNISAILDSFSGSYDKRVRPNYGGELTLRFSAIFIKLNLFHSGVRHMYVICVRVIYKSSIKFGNPDPRRIRNKIERYTHDSTIT